MVNVLGVKINQSGLNSFYKSAASKVAAVISAGSLSVFIVLQ
jgi:hypothetical protein